MQKYCRWSWPKVRSISIKSPVSILSEKNDKMFITKPKNARKAHLPFYNANTSKKLSI